MREKRPQWLYFAAAAALVVLAAAAFLVIDRSPATHPILAASVDELRGPNGRPPSLTREIAILRTRGSAIDAEIPVSTSETALELRVLPEFMARPERYHVRLFRMSADDSLQSVAELGGLVPDSDNFVSIFVDGAHLPPGQYRLAITGDPDTDARDKESAFILKMKRVLSDPSATSR